MSADTHLNTGVMALNAMPDDEIDNELSHLESCESCAAELAGFRETAALLGSAAAETPPASLRRSVMAAIAITPQLPPLVWPRPGSTPRHAKSDSAPTSHELPSPDPARHGIDDDDRTSATDRPTTPPTGQPELGSGEPNPGSPTDHVVPLRRWYRRPAALIAAAVAAVVIGGGVVIAIDRTSGPTDPQVALRECVDNAGDSQVLKPAQGSGDVTFAPSCSAAQVDVSGLPDLPADRTYQLWVLAGSRARSVTLLSDAANGRPQVWMAPTQAGDTAIGITNEPAGGSPQPTSAPIWAVPLNA